MQTSMVVLRHEVIRETSKLVRCQDNFYRLQILLPKKLELLLYRTEHLLWSEVLGTASLYLGMFDTINTRIILSIDMDLMHTLRLQVYVHVVLQRDWLVSVLNPKR